MLKIAQSEITPEHLYLSRRKFMAGAGVLAGALGLAACTGLPTPTPLAGSSSNGPDPDGTMAQATPIANLPEALASAEPYASV